MLGVRFLRRSGKEKMAATRKKGAAPPVTPLPARDENSRRLMKEAHHGLFILTTMTSIAMPSGSGMDKYYSSKIGDLNSVSIILMSNSSRSRNRRISSLMMLSRFFFMGGAYDNKNNRRYPNERRTCSA
jgi:hypothetical protein